MGASGKGSGGNSIVESSMHGSAALRESYRSIDFNSPNKDGEVADNGSVTMEYLHITNQGTQNLGNKFGQNLEPSGEYMTYHSPTASKIDNPNYTYGSIHFKNPLIIEYKNSGPNGWKKDLSEMFGNKTGRALSRAITQAGYDAVMTWEEWKGNREWSEIVNLQGVKKK